MKVDVSSLVAEIRRKIGEANLAAFERGRKFPEKIGWESNEELFALIDKLAEVAKK